MENPVAEYLPEYEISRDLRYKIITPRNILCHSSGFENWEQKPLSIYFEPGSKFLYSGEGYTYLQEAVDNVTGKNLQGLVEEEIFKPLQMYSSALTWTPIAAITCNENTTLDGSVERRCIFFNMP
jgi:CubicO group peptidase (beta-lactamase class C family)